MNLSRHLKSDEEKEFQHELRTSLSKGLYSKDSFIYNQGIRGKDPLQILLLLESMNLL